MLLGSEALRVNGSGFFVVVRNFHCLGDSEASGFDCEPFVTASLSGPFIGGFYSRLIFRSMNMLLS